MSTNSLIARRDRHKRDCQRKIAEAPREVLEEIIFATAQMMEVIDEWLGMASTRNAAADSLWRVRRLFTKKLDIYGIGDNLDWRGSLIEIMWRIGFAKGADFDVRMRMPGEKQWEDAKGPTLAEYIEILKVQAKAAEAEVGPVVQEALAAALQYKAEFLMWKEEVDHPHHKSHYPERKEMIERELWSQAGAAQQRLFDALTELSRRANEDSKITQNSPDALAGDGPGHPPDGIACRASESGDQGGQPGARPEE